MLWVPIAVLIVVYLLSFTGVPDCSPSGNPVFQVQSIKGELFVDYVTVTFINMITAISYLFPQTR